MRFFSSAVRRSRAALPFPAAARARAAEYDLEKSNFDKEMSNYLHKTKSTLSNLNMMDYRMTTDIHRGMKGVPHGAFHDLFFRGCSVV